MKLILLMVFISVFNYIQTQKNEFKVYWNVPTFQCHRYGLNFTKLKQYGIQQNAGDKFIGDEISILYDPGVYPAIVDGIDRNGGIPQNGNLERHLKKFKQDLTRQIPDVNFRGLGVIDFEHWRPIFRENWSSLDIYRQRSRQMIKKKYPELNKSEVEKKASKSFEKAASLFMAETLALAKELRPKAKWGYYIFPLCFNFTPKNPNRECMKDVQKDNERSTWMYKTGNALYPSVYLQHKVLNEPKRAKFIEGRIQEGKRMAALGQTPLKLYAYVRFKYTDSGEFVSKNDMTSNIVIPKKVGSDGVIIWGASKDVDTERKCKQLNDYVENVIGPIFVKNK